MDHFRAVWSLLVYCPVAYWMYNGWMGAWGALDFAGGTVIHINAGIAAFALVLVLGNRRGFPTEPMLPHSLILVTIGAGILWFGWFGFNAGSAGAANEQAARAVLNTFIAGAAGLLGWLVVEWRRNGAMTSLGAASGTIAGLAAITPAAGYVGGLFLGLFADLDVFTAEFVTSMGDGAFGEGALTGGGWGGGALIWAQLASMGATLVYSFVLTFGICKLLDLSIGLRVDESTEQTGLDLAIHAEAAYSG